MSRNRSSSRSSDVEGSAAGVEAKSKTERKLLFVCTHQSLQRAGRLRVPLLSEHCFKAVRTRAWARGRGRSAARRWSHYCTSLDVHCHYCAVRTRAWAEGRGRSAAWSGGRCRKNADHMSGTVLCPLRCVFAPVLGLEAEDVVQHGAGAAGDGAQQQHRAAVQLAAPDERTENRVVAHRLRRALRGDKEIRPFCLISLFVVLQCLQCAIPSRSSVDPWRTEAGASMHGPLFVCMCDSSGCRNPEQCPLKLPPTAPRLTHLVGLRAG